MAKAQFQRLQRVWVDSVGVWAVVDRVVPVWTKGFDEPVRITYDVGLGREFQGAELRPEAPADATVVDGGWRVLRARNKWQTPEDCVHHPNPGTFPVVVTDPNDWGGWRTPGAEYDRDPARIERQARLIAAAPRLKRLAESLVALSSEAGDDAPPALQELALEARDLLRQAAGQPAAATPAAGLRAA